MIGGALAILVLSFVPMLIYAAILWWLDRYEKEPLGLLTLAFIWGALPSVVLALIMQLVLDVPLTSVQDSSQLTYELLGASVVAPLTEEGIKAVALLLLLLLLRHQIDSPLDGLIYGGMVGFGFAAVENIFYLFGAYSGGGLGSVIGLAFLRAGVFGLNHAMYTGFTGLGVALALEVRHGLLKVALPVAGLAAAVATHALHNALATVASYAGGLALLAAVLVDWSGVLALIGVAFGTFFLERRRIIAYGQALVQVNTLSPDELNVLKSTFQRRLARLDLLFRGDVQRWWKIRRYHQKVTKAAFAWHRLQQGDTRARPRLVRLEQEFRQLRGELTAQA